MTVTKGFILVLFLLLASLQVQVHGKVAIKVSSGKSKGKATKSNTLKTTQKGFIVPKKLTFGFMVKTFFMSMVDPTIGTTPAEKEKAGEGKRKLAGPRRKLGGIQTGGAADGLFTGGPSVGMVCGPNDCS